MPLNLRVDKAVHQEEGDRVERATTTDVCLAVAHANDNILKTLTTRRMIEKLDKDKDVNLVNKQGEVQEITETSKDDDDATLAETLLNIRRSLAKDKGKRIMQETELRKKLRKKEMTQLSLDEELAQKLYAEELAKEAAR
nr:hypothetical protein [Tanacetum cinerariifolium]